ncbi:MAG: AarF/UbiB family protein, partial [Pseudomonadota bacterium]
ANVGTLLRYSGLLPPSADIAPMLEEAKRQLHEEADYRREAAQLARFHALLADRSEIAVPQPAEDLTTENVLAMSFVPGQPIETLATAPQAERDRIISLLLELMLREVFAFGLVQTDPNFANYRYDPETGRLILLDFGAVRAYPPAVAETYRPALEAVLRGGREELRAAAILAGFFTAETAPRHQDAVLDMMEAAALPFRRPGPFDFGADRTARDLREAGLDLAFDREFEDIVPMDTLYLQRKVAGMYLLARRLGARVDVRALALPWLAQGPDAERRASAG